MPQGSVSSPQIGGSNRAAKHCDAIIHIVIHQTIASQCERANSVDRTTHHGRTPLSTAASNVGSIDAETDRVAKHHLTEL
jgi:hypothetical protein